MMSDDQSISTGARRPSWQFMWSHPAHLVSLGLGSGLAPFAPGTFGSLLGLFAARWLQSRIGDMWFLSGLLVAFALGIWAVSFTGRALGESDHGSIVWDEVVAMALVVALLPGGFGQQVLAFLLFRFFDIRKPGPVGWSDRSVKGGLGVMLDDLIAVALTLLVMAVGLRVMS